MGLIAVAIRKTSTITVLLLLPARLGCTVAVVVLLLLLALNRGLHCLQLLQHFDGWIGNLRGHRWKSTVPGENTRVTNRTKRLALSTGGTVLPSVNWQLRRFAGRSLS